MPLQRVKLGDFLTLDDLLTLAADSASVAIVVRESRAFELVAVKPESRFRSSCTFVCEELPSKLGSGEVLGRRDG